MLKVLGKMDFRTFFKLFDSQVTSALMYGSELWGQVPYEAIETVHTFAIKKLLGVRKQTPNCLIYGETGRYPLCIESKIRCIKYWYKIINMEPARLPRLAYERELNENKPLNWAKGIKELLDKTGYGYIWELGHTVQINAFCRQLKLRLKDMYIQCWQYICDSSGKFVTYRSMKVNFQFEPYLNLINIAKFRIAFTRLRIAASYLHINRKLITKNPNVKCPFCDLIEDELHFILHCNMYKELRKKYIIKHFDNLDEVTVGHLLNNSNNGITIDVAVYAQKAFEIRSQKLREMKMLKKTQSRQTVIQSKNK